MGSAAGLSWRPSPPAALIAVGLAALALPALAAGCGGPGTGSGSDTCSCQSPLVCARSAPADCVDPAWAAWPMPNGPTDVAAGAPNPMAYAVNGDGTVTDMVTGLVWQQGVPSTLYTWTDAIAYCSALALAGHGDWRVPTEIELISLIDSGVASGPTIDATAFPGTPEGYYWSSLPMADSPANAWLVDFITGSAYHAAVNGPQNVRCVR